MNDELHIIAKVARELGTDLHHRYGPKYEFKSEHGVVVYVDDYGNYMTVTSPCGRTLASTHPCDCTRVPGNWADHLLALEPAADAKIKARRERHMERANAARVAAMTPYNIGTIQ